MLLYTQTKHHLSCLLSISYFLDIMRNTGQSAEGPSVLRGKMTEMWGGKSKNK